MLQVRKKSQILSSCFMGVVSDFYNELCFERFHLISRYLLRLLLSRNTRLHQKLIGSVTIAINTRPLWKCFWNNFRTVSSGLRFSEKNLDAIEVDKTESLKSSKNGHTFYPLQSSSPNALNLLLFAFPTELRELCSRQPLDPALDLSRSIFHFYIHCNWILLFPNARAGDIRFTCITLLFSSVT